MLYQTIATYKSGTTSSICTIAEFAAGTYPVISETMYHGSTQTDTGATKITPNIGESYADFVIRANAVLTANYNQVFGVGNWVGGLIDVIYETGLNLDMDFDGLEVTGFKACLSNDANEGGIALSLDNSKYMRFELVECDVQANSINYEENVRLNAGNTNHAKVR